MIHENELMVEKRHLPKVCSKKRISIWTWWNVDTYLHYENMQQTETVIRHFDPQLTITSDPFV